MTKNLTFDRLTCRSYGFLCLGQSSCYCDNCGGGANHCPSSDSCCYPEWCVLSPCSPHHFLPHTPYSTLGVGGWSHVAVLVTCKACCSISILWELWCVRHNISYSVTTVTASHPALHNPMNPLLTTARDITVLPSCVCIISVTPRPRFGTLRVTAKVLC